jgi:hypothetical protein
MCTPFRAFHATDAARIIVQYNIERNAGPGSVACALAGTEKLASKDRTTNIMVRIVGKVSADRSRKIEFAFAYQFQDRRRGNHLVHGPDTELRVWCVADTLIAMGEAIRFLESDSSPARNQDCAGKSIQGG